MASARGNRVKRAQFYVQEENKWDTRTEWFRQVEWQRQARELKYPVEFRGAQEVVMEILFRSWMQESPYWCWVWRLVNRSSEREVNPYFYRCVSNGRHQAHFQMSRLWLSWRLQHGQESWERMAMINGFFPSLEVLRQWEQGHLAWGPSPGGPAHRGSILYFLRATQEQFNRVNALDRLTRHRVTLREIKWTRETVEDLECMLRNTPTHGPLDVRAERWHGVEEEEILADQPDETVSSLVGLTHPRLLARFERASVQRVVNFYSLAWSLGLIPMTPVPSSSTDIQFPIAWPAVAPADGEDDPFDSSAAGGGDEKWYWVSQENVLFTRVLQNFYAWIMLHSRYMTLINSLFDGAHRFCQPRHPTDEEIYQLTLIMRRQQIFNLRTSWFFTAGFLRNAQSWIQFLRTTSHSQVVLGMSSLTSQRIRDSINHPNDTLTAEDRRRLIDRIRKYWGLKMVRRIHDALTWCSAEEVIEILKVWTQHLLPAGQLMAILPLVSKTHQPSHQKILDPEVHFSVAAAINHVSKHPLANLILVMHRSDIPIHRVAPVYRWWEQQLIPLGLRPHLDLLISHWKINWNLQEWVRFTQLVAPQQGLCRSIHHHPAQESCDQNPPESWDPRDAFRQLMWSLWSPTRRPTETLNLAEYTSLSNQPEFCVFLYALHHSNEKSHGWLRWMQQRNPELFLHCCLSLLQLRFDQWFQDQSPSFSCLVCDVMQRQYGTVWDQPPALLLNSLRHLWGLLRRNLRLVFPSSMKTDYGYPEQLFFDGRVEWCESFLLEWRQPSSASQTARQHEGEWSVVTRIMQESLKASRCWSSWDVMFAKMMHRRGVFLTLMETHLLDERPAEEGLISFADPTRCILLHLISQFSSSSLDVIDFMIKDVCDPSLFQEPLLVSYAASCGDLVLVAYLIEHHGLPEGDFSSLHHLLLYHGQQFPYEFLRRVLKRLRLSDLTTLIDWLKIDPSSSMLMFSQCLPHNYRAIQSLRGWLQRHDLLTSWVRAFSIWHRRQPHSFG